jgi:hypothetical protein
VRARRSNAVRRLAGEAARNIVARQLLHGGLVLGLAGLLVVASVAETNAVVDLKQLERRLADNGYSTLLLERDSPTNNTIPAQACRGFGRVAGVRAAVQIETATSARLFSEAGPTVSTRAVSPEILTFLRAVQPEAMQHWNGAQLLFDSQAGAAPETANEYLLTLSIDGFEQATQTALTVAVQSLGQGFEGSLLRISADLATTSTCAALVQTTFRDHVTRSASAAFPALEGYTIRWALPSADQFDTPQLRFEQRQSRVYWLAATLLTLCVGLLFLRLRRSDHALYAVGGLGPARMWILVAGEVAVLFVSAVVLAWLTVALSLARSGLPMLASDVGWRTFWRSSLASAVVLAAITWASAQRATSRAFDDIKDR